MQRIACVIAVCVFAVGCQKSAPPANTSASTENREQDAVQQASAIVGRENAVQKADFVTGDSRQANDTPAALVKKFVAALRSGDAREARDLLTAKARYETRRHGLEVDPHMFPNTKFEIGETEFTTTHKNVAYVGCTWLEPNSTAKEFELTWVTKRDEEGWRISGFFAAFDGDEEIRLLNFENVPAMLAAMEASAAGSQTPDLKKTAK